VAPAPNAQLAKIADDVWQQMLDREIFYRMKFGLPIEKLPDVTWAGAQEDAAFAAATLKRLDAIDPATLGSEDRITYGILKWQSQLTNDGLPYFWHHSPVTPYATSIFSTDLALSKVVFRSADDTARYLRVIDAYPAYLHSIAGVVRGQAERGIRLPKAEIAIVKATLTGYKQPPESSPFRVDESRLHDVPDHSAFTASVAEAITNKIDPSFQRLLDVFDDAYLAAAPEAVGLSQYPGGLDAYRFDVRASTTLDLTPEEIHRIGLEEVARINVEMQKVRDALGFHGTKAEFHAGLRKDPRFFAHSAEEMAARMTGYLAKVEPHISQYFARTPKAPYDVRRLDPQHEGSQTFGYYQVPTATDPAGHYYFNGSKPEERTLIFAGGLILHELVPGHHFQIARQYENESIPQFRRENLDTAFTEGWGEYAANLGFEMGVYDDPYDRYGRLLMDGMIASRLVVDTGLNAFGWSRERASQFMRENTLMSDTEIATETLRYAADIPGQALAYKLGSKQMLALRQRAKDRLGPKFDIRQFHEWLLGSGSMPLGVLAQHVDREIARVE
jgi:uncharacterized protein (DUF885 family)